MGVQPSAGAAHRAAPRPTARPGAQVIGLITFVMESKGDMGPFMVIAPLSTLTNWALEFARWAPSVEVVVYKGSKEARKGLLRSRMRAGGFHVVVIQYEYVMKAEDLRVLKGVKWSYIIVDEGVPTPPPRPPHPPHLPARTAATTKKRRRRRLHRREPSEGRPAGRRGWII